MKTYRRRHARHLRERGIATVAMAFLIVLFMSLAVLGAASLTAGTGRDAAEENARTNALFLAESGIERAIYRYDNSVACNNGTTDALAETVTVSGRGTVVISSFNTDFQGNTLSSNCRIRATATTSGTGTADQVVRTIETIAIQSSSTTTRGNRKFTCTVSSGSNLGLVVAVAWNTEVAADVSLTGAPTYSGATMTQIGSTVEKTDSSNRYRTALFYLSNPTVGTNVSGAITFSDDLDSNTRGAAFACMPFSNVVAPTFSGGCTTTSPTVIDTFNTGPTGTSSPITVSMTPRSACTGNRYLVVATARDNQGSLSTTGCTGSDSSPGPAYSVYDSNASNATGSFAVCGTVTGAAGATNFGWSWNQNRKWAAAGLVIYAGANSFQSTSAAGGRISANNTTTASGGGVNGWREIIIPPP